MVAVAATAIPLHPPLPLAGVSIAMERERQQNDRTPANCIGDGEQDGEHDALRAALLPPLASGLTGRRRDSHFTDIPSSSILKRLLKGEQGAA